MIKIDEKINSSYTQNDLRKIQNNDTEITIDNNQNFFSSREKIGKKGCCKECCPKNSKSGQQAYQQRRVDEHIDRNSNLYLKKSTQLSRNSAGDEEKKCITTDSCFIF